VSVKFLCRQFWGVRWLVIFVVEMVYDGDWWFCCQDGTLQWYVWRTMYVCDLIFLLACLFVCYFIYHHSPFLRDRDGNKLTPKNVTLYDANDFLILPFTEKTNQSFISQLPSTAGPWPPRFIVSDWWGETVADFIKCIEQFIRDFSVSQYNKNDQRGGGMNANTLIWVCAYGNN